MDKLDFYSKPIVLGRIYVSKLDPKGETIAFTKETIKTMNTKNYIPYEWIDVKQHQAKREMQRASRRQY